ncbi:MAG: DNA-directed RNA polymerase subunit alpha [Cyanobacteria bacterium]|jgi:DNA-directed RNA polymerase subunit alpha|nr:DNA-directed RNA polymerase subunit alpha [Cyanobacteriota bacterium]
MDQLNIKCVNTTTDSDGSIYGKFVIEPLERGYGTTLGNSLRRILLSSLEGAAITSIRVEGVSHEFTTIPGVVEDVLDIMLNLKGIVLKSNSEEPQYLRIDADKPGPFFAGDIEVPADVRVVNPDWLVCTLGDGAALHADLTVEVGKGYVPADQNLTNKAVDTLTLDAAFMPIRRVAYTVEDTRVGQRTDYDKLILEIWSNGSIDVSSALSQAANLLIEHLVPIASLSGIPTLVTHTHVDEPKYESEAPNITIEDLELSVRAFNCLKRANINSIAELLYKSESDLLNIKNFGKKSSDEVIERLQAFGLNLKPNPEGVELPMDV